MVWREPRPIVAVAFSTKRVWSKLKMAMRCGLKHQRGIPSGPRQPLLQPIARLMTVLSSIPSRRPIPLMYWRLRVTREVEHLLLWDTAETAEEEKQTLGPIPYHYLRFARDNEGDVLIVGAEDHKTGQASDFETRFAKLERWTRDHFPFVGEITDHWSGQVMEPVDGMAYIGRNPGDKNVFVVTGDSGNGMTHGTIAGILITDLICGRENPWTKLYDPSRKALQPTVLADYVAENANVVAQLRDYVTRGDEPNAERIQLGEGALLREGVKKIAAYRDDQGTLHKLSAVCPHLKCIVRWNGCEKTWDCPCHGSRFDALGRVLNGPAISDLEEVESSENEIGSPVESQAELSGHRSSA